MKTYEEAEKLCKNCKHGRAEDGEEINGEYIDVYSCYLSREIEVGDGNKNISNIFPYDICITKKYRT